MLNKNHPDFPQFEKAFEALVADLQAEWNALPRFTGLDGPSVSLHRKYERKLEELKKKYAHVYEEDES